MYSAWKNDQFGTITIVANKETLRVSNVAIDQNDSYRLYVFCENISLIYLLLFNYNTTKTSNVLIFNTLFSEKESNIMDL